MTQKKVSSRPKKFSGKEKRQIIPSIIGTRKDKVTSLRSIALNFTEKFEKSTSHTTINRILNASDKIRRIKLKSKLF